ncbi:hypothetical protein BBJ28_00025714 [Nothophytophthora sp. Chile5]|nr:hypothetical protein BBJ28_00025714 [Nothophytophthora sp. Chile5]
MRHGSTSSSSPRVAVRLPHGARRLIHPFASFVHDKVDGLCQELGNAKILAADAKPLSKRGKQATRIHELELKLSTAQMNPPSAPNRDLQLLALASAKDAALTEAAGQRRRVEILEAGLQTLKDRLERERVDRAFEADRLQTKIRKFRQ